MSGMTYKDSGVDIQRGEDFVEKIKQKVQRTYGPRVISGVGGFAALYSMGPEKMIASATDGVGTKILLAQELGVHQGIGQDLVAMCANDLICTGATPLFFLDYLACSKIDPEVGLTLVTSISEACLKSNMALIGGETAEMPGLYRDGEYDLAGFAVGEVMTSDLIDGKKDLENATILGLQSSGVHSNGFSLVRKMINESKLSEEKKKELKLMALTPTELYVTRILGLNIAFPGLVLGLAHITGGGLTNIPRINESYDYLVEEMPPLPEIYQQLPFLDELTVAEKYRTFNMGLGMAIVTQQPEKVINYFKSHKQEVFTIGKVVKGTGQVLFKGEIIS